jgi:hypothetical protein
MEAEGRIPVARVEEPAKATFSEATPHSIKRLRM